MSIHTVSSRRRVRRPVLALALAAIAIAATACGSDAVDTASPVDTVGSSDTNADMDAEMDGETNADMDAEMDGETNAEMDMAMNMGDPFATPADDVAGAVLARGAFTLLDTRPQGYDDVVGSAVIARSAAGTTVTVDLTGLLPNVDYLSHVHAEPCAPNNGGPHYQFDVGGSTTPPNEIHLAFTSDANGNAFMTAENDAIAGADAPSIVVHPAEFLDNKLACADFTEDEPGAIADLLANS